MFCPKNDLVLGKRSVKGSLKCNSFPLSSQSPGKTVPASKERFSGLWEFFYEGEGEGERGGGGGEEGGREGEMDNKLKNIRGFLFKRRKSPLKGWHKVCIYNICRFDTNMYVYVCV